MYLQEIVEVAIGLIFAWLLLSIAVLQIQEVIAATTNKRARDLEATIGNMLKSDGDLKKFYEHPLIQGLMEPLNEKQEKKLQAIREKEKSGKLNWIDKYRKWAYYRKPSYIPAQNFATAIFDVVIKAGTENSPITRSFAALRVEVEKLKQGDQETANRLISALVTLGQAHAGAKIDALKTELRKEMLVKLDELANAGADSQGNKPLAKLADELKGLVNGAHADEIALLLKSTEPYLDQVRRGIVSGGSKRLGEALGSLLSGMEEYATSTDKAIALGRKNIETWFDNTMERMTGWYKRWAQTWAFVIALAIAVILNIDSIHIVQELWRNPAMRQASATYIENFVEANSKDGAKLEDSDLQTIKDEIQKLNYPVGWTLEKVTGGKKVKLFAGPDEVPGICTYLFDTDKKKDGTQPLFCYELKNAPQNGAEIFTKILGFLITALAAMQGAPFWFDILKKLVNVRSTGINPSEKPKEGTGSDKEK